MARMTPISRTSSSMVPRMTKRRLIRAITTSRRLAKTSATATSPSLNALIRRIMSNVTAGPLRGREWSESYAVCKALALEASASRYSTMISLLPPPAEPRAAKSSGEMTNRVAEDSEEAIWESRTKPEIVKSRGPVSVWTERVSPTWRPNFSW